MNGITSATQAPPMQNTQTSKAVSGGRGLNDTTAAYLAELQQKHPDVNITIASFANEKQFDSYIFGCSGNNNLAIAPNILDKMATDPAAAAKYERVFTDLMDLDKYMKEYEKNDNAIVYASGAVIDRNGKVSFWGIGGDKTPRENPGTVFKEKIQKQIAETREKDRTDKAQDKKRLEKADSPQKLMKNLRGSDSSIVSGGSISHEEDDVFSISDEAKRLYRQADFGKLTPNQNLLLFKIPEKGTFQQEVKPELPFHEVFWDGTAERLIFDSLDGKVENAYELAKQLGGMIFDPDTDKDVETTGIDRETGKKLAEYLAKNYFDDPAEAQSFLKGINKIADKSEMRDKGYIVIMGSDIEPLKPSFNALKHFAQEKFGYTDADWNDNEKRAKIVRAFTSEVMNLAKNETKESQYSEKTLSSLLNYDSTPYMYKEEKAAFNKSFDENEKKLQDIINAAKNIIGGVATDDSFFANMNTILSSADPSQAAKWSDIFSILKNQ